MSKFSVTCIIHVVYADERSCQRVGHDRAKYVNVTMKDPAIMRDKMAFVGMVIKGAEELYDRLGAGRNREEDTIAAGDDTA